MQLRACFIPGILNLTEEWFRFFKHKLSLFGFIQCSHSENVCTTVQEWVIYLFQKTQSVKKLPVIKIENSLKPIINRYHHLVIINLSKNWWKILKTQTTMLPILKFLKSLDMMEIILSTRPKLMNSFTTQMSESISNETFGIGILRTKLSNEAHGIIPIIFSRIIRICRMQWHWICILTKFYTEFS